MLNFQVQKRLTITAMVKIDRDMSGLHEPQVNS